MRSEGVSKGGPGVASDWSGCMQEGSANGVQNEKSQSRLGSRNGWLLTWILALTANTVVMGQTYHSQIASKFDLFPGPRGDTRLTAYLLEHWYQTLSGNATLLSPAMFYPVEGTLGRTDVLLAYVLPYSGLRLSGLDIFSALAIAVIALQFMNFVLCFFLLNEILRFKALASVAGALFFAFNNPKLAQTDHLQLQPLFFLLLTVMFLVLFFRDAATISQKRAFGLLSLAAVSLTFQLLTSFYIGWFFIFWCFLFCVVSLFLRDWRLYVFAILKKHRAAVSGGLFVFALGFACFLRIYLPTVWSSGWYGFLRDYIPEIRSYLLVADGNYIWGGLTRSLLQQAAEGPDWGRRVGIGLVPSLAWIGVSIFSIAVIKKHAQAAHMGENPIGHRDPGHMVYLCFALMVLTTNLLVLLGLQYHGHSLWKLVYLFFPGARSIRAVARFVIVMALPMAIAFAFVIHWGMQRISQSKNAVMRIGAMAALLMLIAFGLAEQLGSDSGQYSISAENNRLEKLAAGLPGDCSSFYVAAGPETSDPQSGFDNQNYMHDAMLISILRGIPTLNGRSGNNPPGWLLREVRSPEYEENVQRWIQRHQLKGKVCRLEIDA